MDVHSVISILLILSVNFNLSIADTKDFCKSEKILTKRFDTKCVLCSNNTNADCPRNATKLTTDNGHRNCKLKLNMGNITNPRIIEMSGCSHICLEKVYVPYCCAEYYGPNCFACPKYNWKICNNKGTCNDTISGNGECACQANFTGYACEKCVDSNVYGENCNETCSCVNGVCDSGMQGSGLCECFSGWKGDNCDEEISGCDYKNNHFSFTAVDVCAKGKHECSENATCTFLGPSKYNCSCLEGFRGDGYVCTPIDPCRDFYGGCNFTTSICTYRSPGVRECVCKAGYESSSNEKCELIDLCLTNSSLCDKNADCQMIGPLEHECVCNEGYASDGKVCFNNLMGLIEDIHNDDPTLESKMTWAIKLVKNIYHEEFRYHGPFTVFLPTDFGFRTIYRNMDMDDFLNNTDRAGQVLRQHIIIGKWTMENLTRMNTFYTLQGKQAEIQTKSRGGITYRYRLSGSRVKSSVIKQDMIASNGIIHVVQKLLTNQADVKGDSTKSIFKLLKKDRRYNILKSLIVRAGIESEFEQKGITVFASSNSAWNNLPHGVMDYLKSDEGQTTLKLILRHQIVNETIEVADLINRGTIKTRSQSLVAVLVTTQGQIRLDRETNITQTDIPASNGLFYHMDNVLLPIDQEKILPGICSYYNTIYKERGYCRPCYATLECEKGIPTGEVESCDLRKAQISRDPDTGKILDFFFIKSAGCVSVCNATKQTPVCCSGYYGDKCSICPGGYKNPCSGKGQCVDGLDGNGTCICEEAFTGPACDRCSDAKKFGPGCNKTCTCVHGICNNGPEGDGKCKSCFRNTLNKWSYWPDRYRGENCDILSKPCLGSLHTLPCHIDSSCVRNGSSFRCVCDRGYEGDGAVKCTPINPCEKPGRGGCHKQAVCKMNGPGDNTCTCGEGWAGDGKYCYPGSECGDHQHCHKYASCKTDPSHNKSLCWCNDDFHGNGTYCIPNNMCDFHNGGCHSKANCTPLGPGLNNCTCMEGYAGDGIFCMPTINELILNHPNLTRLAALVRLLGEDSILQYFMDTYTFFAPTDAAMDFLIRRREEGFFSDIDNVLPFINYHTVLGQNRIEDLRASVNVVERYNTLSDGFFLHFKVENGTLLLSTNNRFAITARVIKSNLITANGYVHIIDRALEPELENNGLPTLDDFLNSSTDTTIFADWLRVGIKKKEILGFLTSNYLRYYVLPVIRLAESFDDQESVDTVLGAKHKISIEIYGTKIFLNTERMIVHSNFLTDGGVVHKIAGYIHPNLRICDVINRTVINSACVPCEVGHYQCAEGYTLEIATVTKGCIYSSGDAQYKGCSALCSRQEKVVGCCAGFYGETCSACQGGSEFPCNNNGNCSDGLYGDGTCTCFPGYTGTSCQLCINSTDNSTTECARSCAYHNGGCHENGTCHEYAGSVTCTCPQGFVGDGHHCVRPCEENNEGCHQFAVCKELNENSTEVDCFCQSQYKGNGLVCTLIPEKQSASITSGITVGGIIGFIIVFGLVFLLIIAIRRHRHSMAFLNKEKLGSTESFEKLHPTPAGEENYIALQPSPSSEMKFDNPMYSVKDRFVDEDS
ncbi:stabilin-2-like [Saccostrea cucullata]|uniref:stabilin-2-like n=1 Tax=Saccostrea cuccullata TaxID=36930 RepID=UPI002ED6B3C2